MRWAARCVAGSVPGRRCGARGRSELGLEDEQHCRGGGPPEGCFLDKQQSRHRALAGAQQSNRPKRQPGHRRRSGAQWNDTSSATARDVAAARPLEQSSRAPPSHNSSGGKQPPGTLVGIRSSLVDARWRALRTPWARPRCGPADVRWSMGICDGDLRSARCRARRVVVQVLVVVRKQDPRDSVTPLPDGVSRHDLPSSRWCGWRGGATRGASQRAR
jgi:hypothetical protein